MRKRVLTLAVAVFAAVVGLTTPVMADSFVTALRGLEEVPPIITEGRGFFIASPNGANLDFTLVYFGLSSNVTQAHIHIGQKSVNGGIVLFLCTNLAPPAGVPAPQACPNLAFNVVTGTLGAANVVTQTAQGVAAGAFDEVLDAMRGNASYANVHTANFPGGEIRGQLGH